MPNWVRIGLWGAAALGFLFFVSSPLGAAIFTALALMAAVGLAIYFKIHPEKAKKFGWRP